MKIILIVVPAFLVPLTSAICADWTTFRGEQGRSGYNAFASALSIPVSAGDITVAGPGVTS